jgi:hypothetical protein
MSDRLRIIAATAVVTVVLSFGGAFAVLRFGGVRKGAHRSSENVQMDAQTQTENMLTQMEMGSAPTGSVQTENERTKGSPLTLRISNIPGSITKSDFQRILTNLVGEMGASHGAADQPRLLGWSFASTAASGHSKRSSVATVTFNVSPAPAQLESAIKRNTKVDCGRLRVDFDFFGFTPLADPQCPEAE